MEDFQKEIEKMRDELMKPIDMPIPRFSDKEIAELPNILQLLARLKSGEQKFIEAGGWIAPGLQADPYCRIMPGMDMEYHNDYPENTFFVNRLQSGRYNLKPNLSQHPFLYRGQKEHFPQILSAFERCGKEEERLAQNIVNNLKVEEFIGLLRSHPLFMLLERGIHLDGMERQLFIEMNYYGLCQHYNFNSAMVDFTSDINAAAFFATTENKGNDVYLPYGGASGKKVGVIYIYAIRPNLTFNPLSFRSIGQQLYPRTGAQKGFFFQKKSRQIPLEKLVLPAFFRHDINCAKKVFEMQNKGKKLFPKDLISPYAQEILGSDTVSGLTFAKNIYCNNDDLTINLALLDKKGIRVDWHKRYHFTPETLKAYYADIKNGIWEEFCKPIVFKDPNTKILQEQLLNIPNNPNYKQYFVERYWNQLFWVEDQEALQAERNKRKAYHQGTEGVSK